MDCGQVRELIPEAAIGALDPEAQAAVEAHARACADCRSELELARLLYGTRAVAPVGLVERIERAAAADRVAARAPTQHTWWGVSAAAIAALALGIGIVSNQTPTPTVDVPVAYEAEEGEIWVSDDGLLAGAPALDDLSDEALLQLLDELTIGAGGGAL